MDSLHILFADDHLLFRKGVIAALKEMRPLWQFSEAENGKEALAIFSEKKSIQLVLLDVAMPVMDGIEVCRTIKETDPDVPVIMLTQFNENSLILHLLQLGVNGYLLKNTNPAKVVEAIEMVMHSGKC